MGTTVLLLAYYLARNNPAALGLTATIYLATAIAHLGFERVRRRREHGGEG